MTRQPFNHELRLERALEHLQSLETEVERWLGRHVYGFLQEFDAQRGQNAIRVMAFGHPPASANLLISDCLHNLRSALDNLVYDLALAYNNGNPLPLDVEERVMFPIFETRKLFKSRGAYRIRDIDPRAQAIIEGLQPYVGGNPKLLWELHELSRVDKHRLLHVTLLGQNETVFGSSGVNTVVEDVKFGGRAIEPFGPNAIDGTELVSYRATPVDPSKKMNVYLQFVFGIAFGQGSPVSAGESVLGRLSTLRDHIANRVIPPLTPYLTKMPIVRVSQDLSPLPPVLPSRG